MYRVSNEYVAHILAKYPTFALLKRALIPVHWKESLLTRVLVPGVAAPRGRVMRDTPPGRFEGLHPSPGTRV